MSLFLEISSKFLGLVGRQTVFLHKTFLYRKSIKIIKSNIKIHLKIPEAPKKFDE